MLLKDPANCNVNCFSSSEKFHVLFTFHITHQISFIFIGVVQMKVLRGESKGKKATNNLLTPYSTYTFLLLSCLHKLLPENKCCFRVVNLVYLKEKSNTVAFLLIRLILKKECSPALAIAASN